MHGRVRLFWDISMHFLMWKTFFSPKSLPKHHFGFCLREWISCISPHSQINHLPANCYNPSVLLGYQTMGEYTKCSFSFQPNLSLKCQGEIVWQHVNLKFSFALKKKNEILTQALFLPFKTAVFSCPLSSSLSLNHLISGLVFLTQCVLRVEFLAKSMLHF